MKKFIITVVAVLAAVLVLDTAYYRWGWYLPWSSDAPVTTFVTTDEEHIYVDRGNGPEEFVVKGVNLGAGVPGHWATDYAIDKETYLRWFAQIQELGANTIRVYTILQDDFYDAFYEYNRENPDPLYLIHGVWVNDYVQNSHRDAFDDDFQKTLMEDCRTVVDILHGKKKLSLGEDTGSGTYDKDISQWVLGYILSVEWEDVTVTYTDHKYPDLEPYQGTYLSATEEASAFESMLAEVGDSMISYETQRYHQQRLVAFSNWPTTDPFQYPDVVTVFFNKCGYVDGEHIRSTDAFLSGQFASYHVYPYYPDYLSYMTDDSRLSEEMLQNWAHGKDIQNVVGNRGTPIEDYLEPEDYYDSNGRLNTYAAYLKALNRHHTMPVVISEFGVSTGRGMAQKDQNTGRNQGHMSETEQGEALVACWEDILSAGSAGGCVFTWQDEWFKRTWNTMHAVDLQKTPYWSDYQTNEQYFGLLAFDPGETECVCYVDGDLSEWTDADKIIDGGDYALSVKYDEKFVYLLVYAEGFREGAAGALYVPVDTTQKSGSYYCSDEDIRFDRQADFLLVIDGTENSRLLVQERYEVLRAMFLHETEGADAYLNPPDRYSPVFKPIRLLLQTATPLLSGEWSANAETYETGRLTYGTANPEAEDYNSLADFIFSGDYVEVKIPWQLLNFSDPSNMQIHDDYYECYGVENQSVDRFYLGIGNGEGRITMAEVPLKGWGKRVTYHERLKPSYYLLQEIWAE